MSSLTGNAVAMRARSLVGTRFRPQGRAREHGLDCVGLVALAADLPMDEVPNGYRLRSEVAESGLSLTFGGRVGRIAPDEAGEGDVLLVHAGAGQHHLLILVKEGFVHADAGCRKVVETPGPVPWPTLTAWRVKEIH